MNVREMYKKWHPEQFSDSIIVDKIDCPKDFLSYHIEGLSKSNAHFEFEDFCRKLIERTICPNLIVETGPAAGGDGKVDTENYPVSPVLQEKWYFSQNPNNEKWAFAISLRKDWKEKCDEDIKKIINTNRGYTKIFFISGQAIKNNLRLEYQDKKSQLENIDIIVLDKTWIIDKVLNRYNLDLLSIINVETTVKEVITGKNDYAKKLKLDEIEVKIAKLGITHEALELAIESATLSRELELDTELVFGRYNRAKRYAVKLNDAFQKNNIYYEMAWYSYWWLEDFEQFNEYYNLYELSTKVDISIEETSKLNNLCMLTVNPQIDDLIIKERRTELLRRITLLEESKSKNISLSAKTMKCFVNITQNIDIGYQFIELNRILEEAKIYKEYDIVTTARCIEKLYDIFYNDAEFNKLYDKVTELLSTREKDLEKGDMLYKRADILFNNQKYQEAILYYSQCLTLFYKNESSFKLFMTYCHMGICFKSLGMYYGAKNYFVAAVAHTITEYMSSEVIEPITDVIIEEIITIELENGQVEYALKWFELRNYIKGIIYQYNLKSYDENKEIEKDSQLQLLFSSLLLKTDESKYKYLASLKDYCSKCELDIVSLAIDYITGFVDGPYLKEIMMKNDELDEYMKTLYIKGFEYEINKPVYLDGENISIFTKVLGGKIQLNFKHHKKTSLFADLLLSYVENCTISFLSNKFYPRCEIEVDLLYIESNDFLLEYTYNGFNKFEIKVSYDENKIYEYQTKIKDFIFQFISHYIAVGFMCDNYSKALSDIFSDGVVFERSFNHTNCIYNTIKLFGDLNIQKNDVTVKRIGPVFNIKLENEETVNNISKVEKLTDVEIDFNNISHKNIYSNQLINVPLWDAAKWSGMLYLYFPSYEQIYIGFVYNNEEVGLKIFEDLIKKYKHDDENGEINISFIKGVDRNKIYDYRVAIAGRVDAPKRNSKNMLICQTTRFHHMNCTTNKSLKILEDFISKNGSNNIYIVPTLDNGKKIDFEKRIKVKNIKIINAYELKLSDFEHVVLTPECEIIIPEGFDTSELDKIIKK